MDIEEAKQLRYDFGNYTNVNVRRVDGSGDAPDYEVYFEAYKLAFADTYALTRFLDAIERERAYRERKKQKWR